MARSLKRLNSGEEHLQKLVMTRILKRLQWWRDVFTKLVMTRSLKCLQSSKKTLQNWWMTEFYKGSYSLNWLGSTTSQRLAWNLPDLHSPKQGRVVWKLPGFSWAWRLCRPWVTHVVVLLQTLEERNYHILPFVSLHGHGIQWRLLF